MRASLSLLRGFGLFALVLGLSGALSVSAQGDATPATGETGQSGYPVTAYLCDTDPGPYSPFAAREIGGGCERAAGLQFTVTAESDPSFSEACTTGVDGTCYLHLQVAPSEDAEPVTFIITENVSSLPDGYAPRENPVSDTPGNEYAQTTFINILTTDDSPTEAPVSTETLTAETDGSTAAIYASDCDADFTDEPVATLTNVRPLDGDPAGVDTASAVETSFTMLDLPLDDLLADDHVLVVFDQDDDTVPLACGAIGGVVANDGSLAIALPAVDDSRYAGIAYLTPDGDQTDATVFLAENLAGDATPAA